MRRDKFLELFKECNQLLEGISNGLNSYLESKLHGFPRFFFLSNDELIAILSHTKDLSEIQKLFRKLFEYINTLTIEDKLVTDMCDDGFEVSPLSTSIDTNTPEIEDWLNAFENEMKVTIKENIRESLTTYPKKKKEKWIRTQNSKGIQSLLSKYEMELDEMTELIRQPMSQSIRRPVSCLFILEVHNQDHKLKKLLTSSGSNC